MNVEGLRPDDDLEAGLAANTLRTTLDFDNTPRDRTVLGRRERALPEFSEMDSSSAGQRLTEMLDSGGLSYEEALAIADKLGLLQSR